MRAQHFHNGSKLQIAMIVSSEYIGEFQQSQDQNRALSNTVGLLRISEIETVKQVSFSCYYCVIERE